MTIHYVIVSRDWWACPDVDGAVAPCFDVLEVAQEDFVIDHGAKGDGEARGGNFLRLEIFNRVQVGEMHCN